MCWAGHHTQFSGWANTQIPVHEDCCLVLTAHFREMFMSVWSCWERGAWAWEIATQAPMWNCKNATPGVNPVLFTSLSFLACGQSCSVCGVNAVEPASSRYSDLQFRFQGLPFRPSRGWSESNSTKFSHSPKHWFVLLSSFQQLCAPFPQNRAGRSDVPQTGRARASTCPDGTQLYWCESGPMPVSPA